VVGSCDDDNEPPDSMKDGATICLLECLEERSFIA
jgi:hypothetical protein